MQYCHTCISLFRFWCFIDFLHSLETVVYFNIRVEQEGMNVSVLQEEMGEIIAVATKVEHTFGVDDGGDDFAIRKDGGGFSDNPTKKAELV